MKAVLDTNAWLDWLVFDDPSARELGRAAEAGAIVLLATESTRAEWLAVIARARFGFDEATRAAVTRRYDRHVTLVGPDQASPLPAQVPVCRDPDDRKFVELALAAGADFLVTRDKALLKLARRARRWHGLAIVRPEDPTWRDALAAL
jgi:putative PIN family toxin of toxin-antitoxin system